MYAGGVKVGVCVAMGVRWGCQGVCVCIAMGVRWGCQGGCVHSYGCALGVLRCVCA